MAGSDPGGPRRPVARPRPESGPTPPAFRGVCAPMPGKPTPGPVFLCLRTAGRVLLCGTMLPILGLVEVRRAWELAQSNSAVGDAARGWFAPCAVHQFRACGRFSTGLDCSGAQCALADRRAIAVRARILDQGVRGADAGRVHECGRWLSAGVRSRTTTTVRWKNGHPTRYAAGACRIRMQAMPRTFARLPETHNTVANSRLFHVSNHRHLSFARANARARLTPGSAGRWRAGARPAGADTGPSGKSPLRV
jgi:hypothetical protein